jgi:hypothetical protein
MGYAPPEHRRFRCVVSYFYYCLLLKKHGFKSKPYISVRMRPLVHDLLFGLNLAKGEKTAIEPGGRLCQ